MLSPEYYAFKRIQKALNTPYILLGWVFTVSMAAISIYLASQELLKFALIFLALAMYFLFGTLTIPATGPAFLASRADAIQSAKWLLEDEIKRNPALDLEHLRRLVDNERKVRSSAAIIWAALEEE